MNHKKELGFTLLEAMITMVIVSVGLLGTAQMLLTVLKQNRNSELRIDASAAVHTLLNEASARITTVDDCTSLAVNTDPRTYLGADYIETVSCSELGSGKEHYRIYAKIERPAGKVLAESSTIITTSAAAN